MIEWERDTAPYSNGELGYLGKYPVFNVFYNSNGIMKYSLSTELPGLRSLLGIFESQYDAKKHAEHVIDLWLSKAELEKGNEPTN